MEIGDQTVTAKIKEREEAKQEFEEAKSEGKSASLLEEQRPNVFNMNVANIMPGDTVKAELHYTELITPTDGAYQFVFPTVVGPRYSSPSEDGQADDNQWAESPYLKEGKTPARKYNITVNLSDPEDYAGNRDFILDYQLTGDKVLSGLILNKGEKENFFLLTVQLPRRYQPEDIPPREYNFVLDVSGSMYGYPLDTARDLIKDLVTGLRTTDAFNLILFSGTAAKMAPASIPATAENVQKAIDLIDEQEGFGGTELAHALKQAVTFPAKQNVSRSIITITDGYISGEAEIFDIIDKNLGTANFFSFGIGSSVNRYLIDGIAKTGLGESFVVTDSEDAKDTAQRFRTYIQAPLLTDVKIAYDGFDVYDTEPFHRIHAFRSEADSFLWKIARRAVRHLL